MHWSDKIEKEIVYRFSRSTGPGGQNVNKLSTKVELALDLKQNLLFDLNQKALIYASLANRINKQGVLKVQSQKWRSQKKNKQHGLEKLILLLTIALKEKKTRRATRPSKHQKMERLRKKRMNAQRKHARKKVNLSKQIDLFSLNVV